MVSVLTRKCVLRCARGFDTPCTCCSCGCCHGDNSIPGLKYGLVSIYMLRQGQIAKGHDGCAHDIRERKAIASYLETLRRSLRADLSPAIWFVSEICWQVPRLGSCHATRCAYLCRWLRTHILRHIASHFALRVTKPIASSVHKHVGNALTSTNRLASEATQAGKVKLCAKSSQERTLTQATTETTAIPVSMEGQAVLGRQVSNVACPTSNSASLSARALETTHGNKKQRPIIDIPTVHSVQMPLLQVTRLVSHRC